MEDGKNGMTSPGGPAATGENVHTNAGTAAATGKITTTSAKSTVTASFLEKNRKLIIEEFVAYFGEDYREKITQKINDVTFVCVPPKIVSLSERDVSNIENWFNSQDVVNEELKEYTLNNLNDAIISVDKACEFLAKEKQYIDDFFEKKDIDTDAIAFKYIYGGQEKKPNFKKWYKKLLGINKDNINSESSKNILKCMGILYYRSEEFDLEELLSNKGFIDFAFNKELRVLLNKNDNDLKNVIKNTGFYKDSSALIDGLQTSEAEKKNIDNVLFNYYFSGGLSGQTIATTCHYLDEVDDRMKSVIISPIQNENLDVDLIHELLHVLGADIIEKKQDGYVAKYGACEVNINNTSNDIKTNDRNKTEIPLDEAIVDLTAEEIAMKMHRKGLCIASFAGRMTDGYEVVGYVRSLFGQNKKLMQSPIISNNSNAIESVIGKDNYNYLLKYIENADNFIRCPFDKRSELYNSFNLEEMEEELLELLEPFKYVSIGPNFKKS
ncbi:MAG: hypothetical protein E7184_03225 [Erysipelotrichaceae bacterium]|nr:hypothetical protein [Erysipelotrichaceae bacterium]